MNELMNKSKEVFITTESLEINEKIELGKHSEWIIKGTNIFGPGEKSVKKLPAGFYEMYRDPYGTYLELKTTMSDELYILPSDEMKEIIEDIKNFWNNKKSYENYKFVHKRGILMYGKPGNGKSGIIQLISKYLIEEQDGIIINITNADKLSQYDSIVGQLREIEPNRPLIVILEDLDAMIDEDSWIISTALNLLDGVKQIGNVVYIATTNYPEKLEDRITNRPSRFDRKYEIPLPNTAIRKEYIKCKLTSSDLEKINLNIWVSETEGMSLAHLKELIISVIVLNNTFEDSINRLNGMKKSTKTEIKVD